MRSNGDKKYYSHISQRDTSEVTANTFFNFIFIAIFQASTSKYVTFDDHPVFSYNYVIIHLGYPLFFPADIMQQRTVNLALLQYMQLSNL